VIAVSLVFLLLAGQSLAAAQDPASTAPDLSRSTDSDYILGPGDQIKVWALGVEEITDKPMGIDPGGFVDLPMIGRVKASGLSVEQLKSELVKRLAADVREPRVAVDIVEFGSQPVSVIGSVGEPGVHQLRGRKTLAEVLSLAGGLRDDAGSKITVTRSVAWGEIPLPNARPDPSGKFSVAEVRLKDFLSANRPMDNIVVRPHDLITVPRADTIYVIGSVRKAGGFTLNEREGVSVLQALALAEGLGSPSSAQNSKILRPVANGERKEIAVDLKKVMAGKAPDFLMQPDDILFVPESTSKKAMARVLEVSLGTLSSFVVWRGF
jgi:polysaccharide export outer membrane protein